MPSIHLELAIIHKPLHFQFTALKSTILVAFSKTLAYSFKAALKDKMLENKFYAEY
ncbi:MAG: hypothetical protein RLZZ424_250 [Bacteroidota bacterium]|jgi:hypothetical protein